MMPRLLSWWKAATGRSRLEREMDSELRFHIESYVDDLVRSGVPQAEAVRRARLEFGGVESHKEAMRASLGLRLWDELWADVRYGARMLHKSPSFTFIAVASLALGIGANTVIFTLAKQVLLDKLQVTRPDELLLLAWNGGEKNAVHGTWGWWDELPGGRTVCTSFSYPVYKQLRAANTSLNDLFAFKETGRLTATIDGHAESVNSEMVSGNYYKELKIQPQIGRSITEEDDRVEGGGPVVVLSDAYWASRFGRDPNVIGKTIELNLHPVTIVGVNPRGFTGASRVQFAPDVFFPFSMQHALRPMGDHSLLSDNGLWWTLIMARAKPGVSLEQAQAALDVSLNAAAQATLTPKKDEEIPRLQLLPGNRGENQISGTYKKPVYVLLALVGFVLLLACANIANLLLARSSARQREMGVRLAMGASRGRVLRQVLTESLMLSAQGGGAGLLLAYFGRNLLPHLLQASWEPSELNGQFDPRVFAFTAAISLLTGLLFGVGPAWLSTRLNVSASLKDSAQTVTHKRKGVAGKSIVVFQVALSTLLLVGAGLFVRTLVNLSRVNVGFAPHNLVLFSLSPPQSRYEHPKERVVLRQIEERLKALPGVESATLSDIPLIAGSASNTGFHPTGVEQVEGRRSVAFVMHVGSDFFHTFKIPLVAGRTFDERDSETSTEVAIVNQQLIKQFFPGSNPIGRTFKTDTDKPPIQIVGVVADAKYSSLKQAPPATFYLPYRQSREQLGDLTFEVRTAQSPATKEETLRKAVQSVDGDLAMNDVRTQIEQINQTITQERLFAALTAGFGVVALILACIGIYGLMAYSVARRINEIGIRMVLGARAGQVLRMVLGETSWLAVCGVAIGLGAALGLTRLISSMLYQLKTFDPLTLICSGALLLAIALLAGWVPARRAARIQPMQALRHE